MFSVKLSSAEKSLQLEIKQRREALNVTQEQLAEICGVGLRTLKQFESGKGNPTLKTLYKLADALGLKLKFEVKKL